MIRPHVLLMFGVLSLTSACSSGVPPATSEATGGSATADADVTGQIDTVLDRYFQAVERRDLASFQMLLTDPEDVSVVTPTGRLQTPEDLKAFFRGLQDAYKELHLRRTNVSIRIEGSAAWVAYDWELDGAFADGSPAKFAGWETQVQRSTPDGWRIAHVHYSVPLVVPAAP